MPCILHNGSQLILTNFWRACQVGVGVAAVVIPLVAVGGGGGDDGGKNLTQAGIFVLFTMTCPFIIIMLTDMWGGSTFLAQQAEVLKQIRFTSPAPLMHKLSSIQVMHSKDILTSPGRS